MRLVARKIYRAFPELDRFSDEHCELYVRRAYGSWLFQIWAGVVCATVFCMMFALCGAVLVTFVVPQRRGDVAIVWPASIVIATVLLAAPFLTALLARDQLLLDRLRRQVGKARCLRCEYSLLGQRMIDGIITCPECGQRASLADLGLRSPEDLRPSDNA
jgi:hypothetical protein